MPYEFLDHTGDIAASLRGESLEELFCAAANAFSDSLTAIDLIEPKRPEEVDVDAPELDLLMVDFLSELLYRFDTRGWLTRFAEVEVSEKDGGWTLAGTLRGETLDPARHQIKVLIKAVTYHALRVSQTAAGWVATVVFDI